MLDDEVLPEELLDWYDLRRSRVDSGESDGELCWAERLAVAAAAAAVTDAEEEEAPPETKLTAAPLSPPPTPRTPPPTMAVDEEEPVCDDPCPLEPGPGWLVTDPGAGTVSADTTPGDTLLTPAGVDDVVEGAGRVSEEEVEEEERDLGQERGVAPKSSSSCTTLW